MPIEDITPAFVLHSRAFKETSLIVDVFSLLHGRVSLLARGVRANHKNNRKALLQAFQPLQVSWVGRGELKTLKLLEANGMPFRLQGVANLSGLYLNELLYKLLAQWDPQPELFELYNWALSELQESDKPQLILREFELSFLELVGYAVDWQYDIQGDLIEARFNYCYVPQQGFSHQVDSNHKGIEISGQLILSVANRDWTQKGSLALARKVSRTIIDSLLGSKELYSRKLLQQTIAIKQ